VVLDAPMLVHHVVVVVDPSAHRRKLEGRGRWTKRGGG
jgi:hypothetical protein